MASPMVSILFVTFVAKTLLESQLFPLCPTFEGAHFGLQLRQLGPSEYMHQPRRTACNSEVVSILLYVRTPIFCADCNLKGCVTSKRDSFVGQHDLFWFLAGQQDFVEAGRRPKRPQLLVKVWTLEQDEPQ